MAKAGGKSITWILLSEAWERAVKFYQWREHAERQLTEWLLAGKLRWRSELPTEGSKRDCDPGSGDPEFWREPIPAPSASGFINLRNLVPTWDQSRAERNSYTLCRIEVAADDLAKLLPAIEASAIEEDDVSAKVWIAAEAKRMKAAGKIREGIRITAFAKQLWGQMKDAAKTDRTLRVVGWLHIKNSLPKWGLWPISSIK